MNSNPRSPPGIMRCLRDHPPTHYSFRVNSFSLLVKSRVEKYESGIFEIGGYKWKLILYPNGNNVRDHISLYLSLEETDFLPHRWEVNVEFKFFVFHHIEKKYLAIQDCVQPIKRFHELEPEWGFSKLLDHATFNKGFLVDDFCVFGVEAFFVQSTQTSGCLSVEELNNPSFTCKIDNRQNVDFDTSNDPPFTCKIDNRHSVPFDTSCPKGIEEKMTNCFPFGGYDIKNGTLKTIREVGPAHCLFQINSFSCIIEHYESETFESGGFKWKLCLYPKGNTKMNVKDHISVYVKIVETEGFDSNWEVYATLKLFIHDRIRNKYLTIEDLNESVRYFHKINIESGLNRLISLKDFNDAKNGYLVCDSCSFGAEIFVIKQRGRKIELPIVVKEEARDSFTWKIEDLPTFDKANQTHYSDPFPMAGVQWKLEFIPNGWASEVGKCCSFYLHINDAWNLSTKQEFWVKHKLIIHDQVRGFHYERKGEKCFTHDSEWSGYDNFLPLEKLNDSSLGYKKNDTVIVQVILTSLSIRQIS